MSRKKRFEQIATEKPEGPKKTSLLGKFLFKRKLEIEGMEREKLPEVKRPQDLLPETKKDPTQTGPRKIDLEDLDREIKLAEIAKGRKQLQAAQLQSIQTQKRLKEEKQKRFEEALRRVESAKSKIFFGLIVICIFVFAVYQQSKNTERTGQHVSGMLLRWLIW